MTDQQSPVYDPPLLEGETDAQWRLRQHQDPESPFTLGDRSLAEVEEAVQNGWPEARCSDPEATV